MFCFFKKSTIPSTSGFSGPTIIKSILLDIIKSFKSLKFSKFKELFSAIDEVPACVHKDNTCRFQTLKREQNPNYYDLIKLFYDKTGVPLLLNTSFNLKGWPIVETFEDALLTLQYSDINYLYKP